MLFEVITDLFLSKITVLLIDAAAFYLAFLVFRDNPRKKANLTYLIMTFLMLLWINAAYIPRLIGDSHPIIGFTFLKIAWFATPLFFMVLYYLTLVLTDKEGKYKKLTTMVTVFGVCSALITAFSTKIMVGIEFIDDIMVIIYGSWMYPFLLVVAFIMVATLVPILKDGVLKEKRVQHFLAGILIFYIANAIFNIAFPIFFGFARFYFFGDYSTIILLVFIAYGILKYKFFNIKVVMAEILTFSIWLILAMDVLTSNGFVDIALKLAVLFLYSLFGFLLVRSVRNEIKQKEQLQKISQELEQANIRLQDLDKVKTEFISVASHQLRTPLSGIKGYLSMILEGDFGKIGGEQEKIIKDVFNNTERLVRLVNVFLNVSRIESGRLRIEKANFNIVELVENSYNIMLTDAERKGLKLNLIKPKSNIMVLGDCDKLQDVILNLIDNAIKYTPAGKIEIGLKNKQDLIRFYIKDSGVGIEPAEAKELFTKFRRGKKIAQINTSGSGLGLFIAKKIIELHGGKIWVESAGENKGSTFIFEIPIKSGEAVDATKNKTKTSFKK